jgi:hypothetical protein
VDRARLAARRRFEHRDGDAQDEVADLVDGGDHREVGAEFRRRVRRAGRATAESRARREAAADRRRVNQVEAPGVSERRAQAFAEHGEPLLLLVPHAFAGGVVELRVEHDRPLGEGRRSGTEQQQARGPAQHRRTDS